MKNFAIARNLIRLAREVVMLDFPEIRQAFGFDCGAAACKAVLAYYGIDIIESDLMKRLGTREDGTPSAGIVRVCQDYGLDVSEGVLTIDELKQAISDGYPVIIALQAWAEDKDIDWSKEWEEGHYCVAVGYGDGRIIFEDPSDFHRQYLTEDELMERWHDTGVEGSSEEGKKFIQFGIIVKGKKKFTSDRVKKMEGSIHG